LSLLAIDIDYFKKVNDNFGHDVGDQVLKNFADIAQLNTRSTDLLARCGGEEFFVVLPRTNAEMAARLAERLRVAIETDQHATLPAITVSTGVTELVTDDKSQSDLTHRADSALYAAKHGGRNQVVTQLAPSDLQGAGAT
jgi:diguanylate cyclase (GGDEF)-like protein